MAQAAVTKGKKKCSKISFVRKKNITISSSYAKILGKTNFHTQEFPRSGSKAKDGEKKIKRRLNDGSKNGQLRIANATSGRARKAAWAN